MPKIAVSKKLIHKSLAKDIYSKQGVLLLSEGHILNEADINQLLFLNIQEVEIIEELSSIPTDLRVQYDDLWQENNQTEEFKQYYIQNLENIKKLFENVKENEPDISTIHECVHSFAPMLEQVISQGYIFQPLHKIKGHDEYTYRHSINVGLIGGVIGKLLELSSNDISLIGQMGLLHDVGKIKISDKILNKPGPLTKEEYDEVKKHTLYGYQIIKKLKDIHPLIGHGALAHHERLDGSGYPHRIREKDIPLLVQIICVADTYDAICSDRVYKPKSSFFFAAQELLNGSYQHKYNPKITLPFVHYLAQSFIGHKVILDAHIEGEVVFVHPDEPLRPMIRSNDSYIDLKEKRELQITNFY